MGGVLGVAMLLAYSKRRDPVDRSLAIAMLWICVTGILGLLLSQVASAGLNYFRMALRLTGPVLLLVVCEESVRVEGYGGSRKNSLLFGGVLWALAVGGYVYRAGNALADNVDLSRIGIGARVGVTAWMALVLIAAVGALLAVVPAAVRRIKPGLAGIAALVLLASELWASVDAQWNTGAAGPLTYRTLLTLGLSLLAFVKAFSAGFPLSMSSASEEAAAPKPAGKVDGQGKGDENEAADEAEPGEERSTKKPAPRSGKKRKKR